MNNIKSKTLKLDYFSNMKAFFNLMKPRVMSLVIFTCAVGLLTAPNLVSTKEAIIGILLVSLGAGAAGACFEAHLQRSSLCCPLPFPSCERSVSRTAGNKSSHSHSGQLTTSCSTSAAENSAKLAPPQKNNASRASGM